MQINNMLKEYTNKKPVRFHMPGNKGGKDFVKYLKSLANKDITELSFSDDLLKAKGVIKKSEKEYAKTLGVKKCIYSTNGSTISNYSIFRYFKNQSIIYGSSDHRSIKNACELFHIKGIRIKNKISSDKRNIPLTSQQIEKAIKKNRQVKAVILTYPDYYGSCADIKAISKVCKKYRKYLIVDSAHGAHFAYSKLLPETPSKYADAYVISPHKTMPALTGASVICIKNLELGKKIEENFRKIHSTSPSYLCMASIEYANEYMLKYGEIMVENIQNSLSILDRKLRKTDYKRVKTDDLTRILIECKNRNGRKVQKELEKRNIYIELFDNRYLVLIASVMNKESDFRKLARALRKI